MAQNFMTCTPAELRALIARRWRRPLFVLAAEVGIHPNNLSRMLRDKAPLSPEIAKRVVEVVGTELYGIKSP